MKKSMIVVLMGIVAALVGSAQAAHYGVFVGLNEYNTSYVGSGNWLSGCVPDANHIYTNTIKRGGWTNSTVTRLLNSAGTKTAIRQAISNYAATATSGDTFLYYHSSHGGQNSGTSVYLCSYNADYQDTEVAADLATFATGVKVIVIVDACHSGGLFKSAKLGTRARAVKGQTWDFAGNVTRIMDENRAAALADGKKGATARVSSSEIGWITAADYDQYSWDGDTGGLFTDKVIEGWTNAVASSCDLNGDGYANFYELYDYSWDVANDSSHEYTEAQAQNTNVLLNTQAGWIGATAPGGLIVFSNLTAQTVVVGQTLTYPVGACTSGTNLPAFVTMTTVQAGASYAGGQLAFTPTNAGTYTFNFSATNSAGSSAAASLTVTATLAAPASIWASATNNTDFTATWGTVSGATSYRLDVATNSSFATGGSGSNRVEEGFASATPADWTISAGGTYSSSPYVGSTLSGTYSIKFSATGNSAVTPTFAAGATNLQFWAYGNGSGTASTFAISGLVNSVWTLVDTVSIAIGAGTYNIALDSQTTQLNFYFTKNGYNCAFDDVVVQAVGGSSSFVAGYQDRAVAGTSQSVTGLVSGATCYFRARAMSSGGTGLNSATASVTTLTVLSAPVFNANPGPVATTAGVVRMFTVGATGSPTPALALASQTASSGYGFVPATGVLTYTPPQVDAGTRTFTFSASNGSGVAYQTVTVAVVAAAAPAFTSGSSYSTTTGVALAWTVTASGTPTPTLAQIGETVSGEFSFTPATGAFTYTPVSDDIGTQTFTFTAANAAGTATQVVSVVVSDLPATLPVFGANPGPLGATTGVARTFMVTVASGNPAPTLALRTQTASSGYGFVAGTGVLTYTPPEADVGTRTFTFTASNSAGVASQTVSVAVAAGIPGAPASIWASATNTAGFTAAWSSVANATSYRLDVGTNATFAAGGGAGAAGTNCSHAGTLGAGTGGIWTETGLTQGSGYLVSMSGDALITPAMDFTATTAETLNFKARTYGGVNSNNNAITVSISTDNGNNWATLGTRLPSTTTLTAMSPFDLSSYVASQVLVKFETLGATASVGVGIDDVLITNLESTASAAYMPGYSNLTVAGTSQAVTGLTAGATYYFRARAVNASGTGANSSVASVSTTSNAPTGTPPTVNAIAAQSATAGGSFEYTVTATATDGDPILSYACTTAVDGATWDFDAGTGDFLFLPTTAQLGTNWFSFTATDKDGESAPAQMSVKVYSAAASNEFTQWVEDQEEDPADPDFAENADIDGDGADTYEEFLADTDPAASNSVLRLEGQSADLAEFSFPASPARYYQLEYCTDITNQAGTRVVTNLGWGVPGMVITNDFPASWFGTIRVLLDEP